MGKTRVHLLAKELGIETKDLIAQLDKLGLRGRKAQSALEDDEVARVRAALAAQEKPQVHVGEEKIVADRMVKSEDEGEGGAEARETVVERRVRANAIRRRPLRVPQQPRQRNSHAHMSNLSHSRRPPNIFLPNWGPTSKHPVNGASQPRHRLNLKRTTWNLARQRRKHRPPERGPSRGTGVRGSTHR